MTDLEEGEKEEEKEDEKEEEKKEEKEEEVWRKVLVEHRWEAEALMSCPHLETEQ